MNEKHISKIFDNYIEKFDTLNDSTHREYYKWQIAKMFRPMMEEALSAPAKEFSTKLKDIKKMTSNFVDSSVQPFGGLVAMAEIEPETVQKMFINLFVDDGGNLTKRQEKITNFLEQCHTLKAKYFPDSFMYKSDFHSVTCYLFLYDPENNYAFKATNALEFADCVEFMDDWGSGENVRLDVYYRMCDQLVEKILKNEALLKTAYSKYEEAFGIKAEELHPDLNKHILAFDIIYDCAAYGLFDGVTFNRVSAKERILLQERKEKARELNEKYKMTLAREDLLKEIKAYLLSVYTSGVTLKHKKYGAGVIKSNTGGHLVVDFGTIGEKKFGIILSVANDIIRIDVDGYEEKMNQYREILKDEESILRRVSSAQKDLEPYLIYLE